jgi:adenylate cyclase
MMADVAGYSRLMGADEVGTVATLTRYRTELWKPTVAAHDGRIINMAGDSALVEFGSPTAAVECAIAIQRATGARNADLAEDRRMHLRLGIHSGEIIVDGGAIYGDAVNIAARVQALAHAGGIAVSGKVHDEVAGKIDADFEDLGDQQVKNITRPIRVWRVQWDGDDRAGDGRRATLPLPEKPSIAVLPFANLNDDPEQEYFADGMVEEITTALSRVREFFVVDRSSTFTYKGRSVDAKQVGQELGVRYVLSGSVRRAGNRVRIACQLIDASANRQVWADRTDGEMADIFDLQDQVTEKLVGAIEPQLQHAEIVRSRAKPTSSLDAYDLYLRALPHYYSVTKDATEVAETLMLKALDLDPGYTLVKAQLALLYYAKVARAWARPGDIERGARFADEALDEAENNPTVLSHGAIAIARLAGDRDRALAAINRALVLNPNSATAFRSAAYIHMHRCEPELAIERVERARRLSPFDPMVYSFLNALAFAHFIAGRYEDAIVHAKQSLSERPNYVPPQEIVVVALMALGRVEEARDRASSILTAAPGYTISGRVTNLFADERLEARYKQSLRDAGLPD